MSIYENLEKTMLGIQDYELIPVSDSDEKLVAILDTRNLRATQRGVDMQLYRGMMCMSASRY